MIFTLNFPRPQSGKMAKHLDSSGDFAARNQHRGWRICGDFKADEPLLDSCPQRFVQRGKHRESARRDAARRIQVSSTISARR
jgi:hypothetical protein